ncbi:MAG: guanine deaminase [Woeseiaceae bacterium]|nr:guanine deaminase [Woeseiaceae bacterium]
MSSRTLYRAGVAHCLGDPGERNDTAAFEVFEDGALLVEDGHIVAAGHAADIAPGVDAELVDFSGSLIVPGFIDCHVHFPQLDIIASFGEQLMHWLERYAYPGELRLADEAYARELASLFVDQLIANGTTSALVFATVHPHSADFLFEEALAKNLRLVAGKVLMDRDAPVALCDTAETGYADSRVLIEKWHGRGRLGYAITPRFALTSSEAQLESAGRLAAEYPDVWIHTHLAENHQEVAEVQAAFPWSESYLGVYERFGLLRERAVFAHCLHLSDEDCRHMSHSSSSAAFCPTSNLFLGSGLYDLRRMTEAGIRTGLATDVGGGTSLSMLRTMGEAYKVLQLKDQVLPPARALYLATLGAAEALGIDAHVGNFKAGKEADFVVLDPSTTPLTAHRDAHTETLEERLFALMTLGDDRQVAATAIAGRLHRH